MPRSYADLLALLDAAEAVFDQKASVNPVADTATDDVISTEGITNAEEVESIGDGQSSYVPKPLKEISAAIYERTGGWPRRAGGVLFVHDPTEGICWLEKPSALFGWIQSKCGVVEWHSGRGFVSKEELFEELKRTATKYRTIEYLPHHPLIPGHYYACNIPEPGNGEILSKLLDCFAPETEIDRLLILAMFATPFWGGQGGQRPMFVVISDHGRGAGKSKLTDMVANLAGGNVEITNHEDSKIIRERLLSPDGMDKRIVRIDNVKSLKFSWAELESMVTAPCISGKRLYVGEGSRPNTLTWLITLNGVSLSTDMAQRSVVVKVVKPVRSGAWEADTLKFINENREAIIADIIGFLQIEEATKLVEHSRWAAWENDVLCRLENAAEIQEYIQGRARGADSELEEAEELESYFRSRLDLLGYDTEIRRVHIPSAVAGKWYREVTNDKQKITIACSKIISQFCQEGRISMLEINPSRKYGRGFIWGDKKNSTEIDYDIKDRIEEKTADAKNNNERHSYWWER